MKQKAVKIKTVGGRCRCCKMLSGVRRGCQGIINITLRGLSDAHEVHL